MIDLKLNKAYKIVEYEEEYALAKMMYDSAYLKGKYEDGQYYLNADWEVTDENDSEKVVTIFNNGTPILFGIFENRAKLMKFAITYFLSNQAQIRRTHNDV